MSIMKKSVERYPNNGRKGSATYELYPGTAFEAVYTAEDFSYTGLVCRYRGQAISPSN